jgi:hypothetical protein
MNQLLFKFFVFSLFYSLPAHAVQRICYFSFNNQSEVETTQQFVNQINRVASEPIEVKEFLNSGSNPEKSFLQMVESGEKCDGLVISGHHTGAHGGKRAAGKLDLEFIEKLSCDPRYNEWFRGINALWLEGCRTVGVGTITPQNESEEKLTVDYHVKRVTMERQVDGLTQSVANLDHEFSNTLDQDNPLKSRYLRSFPKAKIFGWTNSAPGEKADSERSLLFHMAHIAKYLDPEYGLPEDPLKGNISARGLQDYLNAINLALMPFSYQDRTCENIAVQGWIDHGTYSKENPLYAFDNPDLEASTSLENADSINPLFVKSLECALKNALESGDDSKLLKAVDAINSDPTSYNYTLGPMLSVYLELKAKKPNSANLMFNRMKSNSALTGFLEKKIHSKQVGFVRRADYYSVYREIAGYNNLELERELQQQFFEEIKTDLPRNDKYLRSNTSAYRTTLLQALVKNRIGGEAFFDSVLQTNPEWDVLVNLIKTSSRLGLSKEQQLQKIDSILRSPRADPVVWKVAKAELQKLKVSENEINSIYQSLNLIPEFNFEENAKNLDLNSNQTQPPVVERIEEAPIPLVDPVKKKKEGFLKKLFTPNKKAPVEPKKEKKKQNFGTGTGGLY